MESSAAYKEAQFASIEKTILTELERKAGFKIIDRYLNEETTPVPEHCFVRYGYIIQGSMDMSTHHNYLANQIRCLISKHFVHVGLSYAHRRIFVDNRVNLSVSEDSNERYEVRPDVAVYSAPVKEDLGSIPGGMIPVLVVEILSDSTAKIDLTEKKEKYRELGVKHYWVLRKANDPIEGLRGSYFYVLNFDDYQDRSEEIRSSGVLKCEELYGLCLSASDVWISDETRDCMYQWEATEVMAEQEKQRAEQEKQRAEKYLLLLRQHNINPD